MGWLDANFWMILRYIGELAALLLCFKCLSRFMDLL